MCNVPIDKGRQSNGLQHFRHFRMIFKPFFLLRFFLLQVCFLVLCGHGSASSAPGPAPLPNLGIAGVYSGMIPCADCEGIIYRLGLGGDGRYQERMTYKGKKSTPFMSKGTYTVIGDSLVKLGKKDPAMSLFRIMPDGLLILDAEGQTITGSLADNYKLMKLTRMPGGGRGRMGNGAMGGAGMGRGGPGMGRSGIGRAGMDSGMGDSGMSQGPSKDSLRMLRAMLYRKWRSGIGFYGTGNEPSWSLDIDFRKFMRFILNGDTLITPAVEGAQAMDVNMVRYYKQTPKGTLTVQIMQTDCTNSMTGEQADYRVMIDVQKNGETDPALAKHYEGCGRYIPDFRLEGKWVLKQMNGAKPDTASYPRGVPDLELRVVESRYGGLAGCNRMMGKIIKGEGNKIRFGPAAMTLMFCPNMDKEHELTEALSQVDTYRVMRDQLQLVVRGKTTLIYGRGSRGHRGKKGRK